MGDWCLGLELESKVRVGRIFGTEGLALKKKSWTLGEILEKWRIKIRRRENVEK